MRKHITREQIENAFALCKQEGMEAQGNLIFGDLEETVETALDTINWWKAHQDWALTMHWIIAYPGTHIYKVSCEKGIISAPVQFIKDGCPEVNFSKMTDEERRKIASVMDTLVNERHDILSNARLESGQSGKVTVAGNCPYCGKPNTFFNLDPIRPIKLDVCPKCSRTLRLYASDYMCVETFRENIEKACKSSKIALWPVITGLSKLTEHLPDSAEADIYLVDSSQYKQGLELSGYTIHAPEIIAEKEIDVVFITTSTSISMDIINRIKKDFPTVKKIEIIGNLFFPENPQGE
jgi:hypothetical protein